MSSPVVQRFVVVNDKDPEGLHVRPAGEFAKLAMKFASEIEVVLDTIRADAKSVMHMLTLGAKPGMQLRLEARGDDAEAAVDALVRFVENGFVNEETGRQGGAEQG